MGNGDRRHSRKSLQRKSQRKLKERVRRLASERAVRIAAVGKAVEKKGRAHRKPAASAAT